MTERGRREDAGHRKATIRRLRGRARAARGAIVAEYLCGKLLARIVPTFPTALERYHGLALAAALPETRQPHRPSAALETVRGQVPIRTWGDWAGVAPGAVQGALVLHCGEALEGFFLATMAASS